MHSFVFGNDFTKQPEKHQPIEKMQCENVEGSSTHFFQDRSVSFTKAQVIYPAHGPGEHCCMHCSPSSSFALTTPALPPFQESLSWLSLAVLEALNACLYFQTSVLIKCYECYWGYTKYLYTLRSYLFSIRVTEKNLVGRDFWRSCSLGLLLDAE